MWFPNSYVGVIEMTVWPIMIFVQRESDKEDSVWLRGNAAVHSNPWLSIRESRVACELRRCQIRSTQANIFLLVFPRLCLYISVLLGLLFPQHMFRDYFFSSWHAVVYFNRALRFVREKVKRGVKEDKNNKSRNRKVTSEQRLQFPCD